MVLPTEVLFAVEYLGPRPSKSLSSDLILLAHALIVRPHLFVSKNPEKPKKVRVDLTGHTYDDRCKRRVWLCFIKPILGNRYGPGVIPILTLHLNYVAGYTSRLLFLFERTQQLTLLTTRT